MKRFLVSRMREIRTSGSTRGERAAPFVSFALLLYRETSCQGSIEMGSLQC